MKFKKITEALPLLASFGLMVGVGIFILSYVRADAALEIDPAVTTPPGVTAETAPTNTNTATDQPDTTVSDTTNANLTTADTTAVIQPTHDNFYAVLLLALTCTVTITLLFLLLRRHANR